MSHGLRLAVLMKLGGSVDLNVLDLAGDTMGDPGRPLLQRPDAPRSGPTWFGSPWSTSTRTRRPHARDAAPHPTCRR